MESDDSFICESENEQQVCIYEEEGHWYAYGRSAHILRQLQNGFEKVKLLVNNTYDKVVINRIEVDFRVIIEMFTIILCSDSKLVLKCPY